MPDDITNITEFVINNPNTNANELSEHFNISVNDARDYLIYIDTGYYPGGYKSNTPSLQEQIGQIRINEPHVTNQDIADRLNTSPNVVAFHINKLNMPDYVPQSYIEIQQLKNSNPNMTYMDIANELNMDPVSVRTMLVKLGYPLERVMDKKRDNINQTILSMYEENPLITIEELSNAINRKPDTTRKIINRLGLIIYSSNYYYVKDKIKELRNLDSNITDEDLASQINVDISQIQIHNLMEDEDYLNKLNANQRKILELRSNDPSMTLDEIGKEIGVTRERIRQIMNKMGVETKSLRIPKQKTVGNEKHPSKQKMEERQQAVLDLRNEDPYISLENISKQLNVPKMTIYRDLVELGLPTKIESSTRRKIRVMYEENPNITVKEINQKLNISQQIIRYHLAAIKNVNKPKMKRSVTVPKPLLMPVVSMGSGSKSRSNRRPVWFNPPKIR